MSVGVTSHSPVRFQPLLVDRNRSEGICSQKWTKWKWAQGNVLKQDGVALLFQFSSLLICYNFSMFVCKCALLKIKKGANLASCSKNGFKQQIKSGSHSQSVGSEMGQDGLSLIWWFLLEINASPHFPCSFLCSNPRRPAVDVVSVTDFCVFFLPVCLPLSLGLPLISQSTELNMGNQSGLVMLITFKYWCF